MNANIQRLVDQCTEKKYVDMCDDYDIVFDQENFAQLLIKDCLTHINDRHICDEIRTKFGIVDKGQW